MKKLIVVLMGAVLSLCLFGCSSGDQNNSNESDQSQAEIVYAYMTDPSVVEVMQKMNGRFEIMLDKFESGQYEEADSDCVSAINACNEVLEMKEVPDQVKAAHEKVCEVAQSFCDTFFCYEVASGAMQTGDVKEAASKIEEANGYYGELADKMNDVSSLLETYK